MSAAPAPISPTLAEFIKANPELQNHSSERVLEPEPALTKPVKTAGTPSAK